MPFPNELNDIDKIKYISSIGIMKACDDNQIINYINPFEIKIDWNKLLNNGKDGTCIYVKFANIMDFINRYFRFRYTTRSFMLNWIEQSQIQYMIPLFGIILNSEMNQIMIVIIVEQLLLSIVLIFINLSYILDDWYGNIITILLLPLGGGESALGLQIQIKYYPIRGTQILN